MGEKVIIEFVNQDSKEKKDIEIPVDITANDLIRALNTVYGLKLDEENIFNYYLVSEKPIAFIHGNRKLKEYKIRNGSILYFGGAN